MEKTVTEPAAPDLAGKSRRDFLKYVLGGALIAWIGAVLYPIFAYLKPPHQGEVEVTSVKVGKLTTSPKTAAPSSASAANRSS